MSAESSNCERVRRELLARACEESAGGVPAKLQDHLDACPACARYGEGLGVAPEVFRVAPLYTRAVRQRTLRAIARMPDPSARWVLPGLVPVAILSLLASFGAPVWLGATILEQWISSPVLAVASAILATLMTGTVVTCACGVTLIRRGAHLNT
ncbi:MAG: hypothetical protein HYX75_09630 [Acidobacteria bacterium]|nr:hypothetical protein [Acidobacteriota bacterium]